MEVLGKKTKLAVKTIDSKILNLSNKNSKGVYDSEDIKEIEKVLDQIWEAGTEKAGGKTVLSGCALAAIG